MEIDQDWVTNNIDLIMKEFVRIHPDFKKKDIKAAKSRSKHRKQMLEDMDTLTYRPIYYICQTYPVREKALRTKMKRFARERDENDKQCRCWYEKSQRSEKNLIDEFGEKSYEVEVARR